MDRQAFFDHVLDHLRYQGVKAATSAEWYNSQTDTTEHKISCRYRAPNGNACAIGTHIPKEYYSPAMEELQAHMLLTKYPQLARLWGITSQVDIDFLCHLQSAHDAHMPESEGGSMRSWETQMLRIAQMYRLNYRPGDTLPDACDRELVMKPLTWESAVDIGADVPYTDFYTQTVPKYDYSPTKSEFNYKDMQWLPKAQKVKKSDAPKNVPATSVTPLNSDGSKTKSWQSHETFA